MDNDSRIYSIGGLLTRANGHAISVFIRRVELNRDSGQHSITAMPLTLENVELRYSRGLGVGRMSVGAGYGDPGNDSRSPSRFHAHLIWQQGF
jgi:hypothetical protein